MPRSSLPEESDIESLLSQNSVESGFGEKVQQDVGYGYCLRRCTPSLDTKRRVVVALATIIAALALATLALEALTLRLGPSSDGGSINHCGSNMQEALALGCKFDAINYSWQPPECFHEQVYKRYWDLTRAPGALKWYADSTFTKELPQDIELLMYTPQVWSEHRLHVVHCLYDWELMHYALSMNKPVPEFISRLNHTVHCADTALDQHYRVKDTVIKASHNRCVMLAQVKVG
ncbi:hypothetical protein E5D57_009236 [Metarhizium anisopliae]|nr:hypothetical protein E5D57_009236 [Metarhizium anisopliae]